MKRKPSVLFLVLVVALLTVIPVSAGRGNKPPGVVYVTSQGLYYDTFVVMPANPAVDAWNISPVRRPTNITIPTRTSNQLASLTVFFVLFAR